MAKKRISNYTAAPYLNFEYDNHAQTLTIWNCDGNGVVVNLGGGGGGGVTSLNNLLGDVNITSTDNSIVVTPSTTYNTVDLKAVNSGGGNANIEYVQNQWRIIDTGSTNMILGYSDSYSSLGNNLMVLKPNGDYMRLTPDPIDITWVSGLPGQNEWEFALDQGSGLHKMIGWDESGGFYYYTSLDQTTKNYVSSGPGPTPGNYQPLDTATDGKIRCSKNGTWVAITSDDVPFSTTDSTSVETKIGQLQQEIDSLSNLGLYCGRYETFNRPAQTLIYDKDNPATGWYIIGEPSDNDFITCVYNDGAGHTTTSRYICTNISGNTFTFTFDIYYDTDISGKQDKISGVTDDMQYGVNKDSNWEVLSGDKIWIDSTDHNLGTINHYIDQIDTAITQEFLQVKGQCAMMDIDMNQSNYLRFRKYDGTYTIFSITDNFDSTMFSWNNNKYGINFNTDQFMIDGSNGLSFKKTSKYGVFNLTETTDKYYTINITPNSIVKSMFVKINNASNKPSYIWPPYILEGIGDDMICPTGTFKVWIQTNGWGSGIKLIVEYI